MTITNNCNGAVKLVWITGIWIISIITLVASCSKTEDISTKYTVIIHNNYFETIDSLYFNHTTSKLSIEKNTSKIFENISPNQYLIKAYTKSGLILAATIRLQGKNLHKRLTIHPTGKFTINE